jgi:predicted phosphoadenosine phosphosulfate sulfurtransferase
MAKTAVIPAPRRVLDVDVLTAARERIAWTFDSFEQVCISFSGGKDSTVLLHLTMQEARRRGRRVSVLFIDWEAQYQMTIEHVQACFDMYADLIDPYWFCVPLTTTNACSQIEPEWTCWDPDKRDVWVRQPPAHAITDGEQLLYWYSTITFEEFISNFAKWHSGDVATAYLVGIRASESLNRWRAVAKKRKSRLEGKCWTAWKGGHSFNVYPIYDWRTADIWTYHARTGTPYNRVYDRMHEAGVTPHLMRICEPYGDEQRRGLWLFHALEPATWAKVCARVAGANSGALYAGERGNILGNQHIDLPAGHTWQSFAVMLLDTMPTATAEHYRDKISRYVWYCQEKLSIAVPDEQPGDTGSKDVPSWRRICKVLLRNDYWCSGLSFSPNKAEAYQRYKKIMRKNRDSWGIL